MRSKSKTIRIGFEKDRVLKKGERSSAAPISSIISFHHFHLFFPSSCSLAFFLYWCTQLDRQKQREHPQTLQTHDDACHHIEHRFVTNCDASHHMVTEYGGLFAMFALHALGISSMPI
jgi:hypothetical protein